MVGYGDDRGIVPLAMQELFRRISANKDPNTKYMVEASMMEIYNEKVRDLFNPASDKGQGLKVRDHPQTGPYVEGLSHNLVSTYTEIQRLMDEGTAVRTVAATQMNATSSRAHTVFQITFTTTVHDVETNKDMTRTSRINLVDLAGSERVSKTGATGDQLKEGIGINKSLTALGDCIEKLARKANRKKGDKEVHIPYRNSSLTWLLKESLGGNAKTIMIAAISPSDDNYDESLSTLRYADRAKQIKNSAVVNEDENAKIIRQLKEEINRLKQQLTGGGVVSVGGAAGGSAGGDLAEQERAEFLELKEKMRQNEEIMQRMNMSWEEKLKESEEAAKVRALTLGVDSIEDKKKKVPHMVNLHRDRLMSECLHYFFPQNTTIRLCTKAITPPPTSDDIILQGLQIKTDHARAQNDQNNVILNPSEGARCFVNGKLIKEPTILGHNDRIILGAHLVFRFIMPNHASDDNAAFDWEYAQKELTASTAAMLSAADPVEEEQKRARELEGKLQEEKMKKLEAEIALERERAAVEHKKREEEYAVKMAEMARKKEEELLLTMKKIEQVKQKEAAEILKKQLEEREKQLEAERIKAQELHNKDLQQQLKKQQELEAQLNKQREETVKLQKKHTVEKRDQQLLEENLMHTIPLVNEANAICTELQQSLRFNIKLQAKRSLDSHSAFTERTDILIRVVNLDDEVEVLWTVDELSEHLFEMREIYNNYLQSAQIVIPQDNEQNPFYIKPQGAQQIGSVRIYLQPVYHLLSISETLPIIDYRGESKGQLQIKLLPIPPDIERQNYASMSEEEVIFDEDDISQLKGESIKLKFEIIKAQGLPQKFSKNCNCSYQFFADSREFSTQDEGNNAQISINPAFNYSRIIEIDVVEEELIDFVQNGILEVAIYAEQYVPGEKIAEIPANLKLNGMEKALAEQEAAISTAGGAISYRESQLEEVIRQISHVVAPEIAEHPEELTQRPQLIVEQVKNIVTDRKDLKKRTESATLELNQAKLEHQSAETKVKQLTEKLSQSQQSSPRDEIKAPAQKITINKQKSSVPVNSTENSALTEELERTKRELEQVRAKTAELTALNERLQGLEELLQRKEKEKQGEIERIKADYEKKIEEAKRKGQEEAERKYLANTGAINSSNNNNNNNNNNQERTSKVKNNNGSSSTVTNTVTSSAANPSQSKVRDGSSAPPPTTTQSSSKVCTIQ
jgi:hypothetical protein